MSDSIYMAFAVSVLRSALLIGGGWLVQRGLVEDGLMREVAAGLALILVTQLWGFIRISQRALYEKWVLWLAMREPATSDPNAAAAVKAEARFFTKERLQP